MLLLAVGSSIFYNVTAVVEDRNWFTKSVEAIWPVQWVESRLETAFQAATKPDNISVTNDALEDPDDPEQPIPGSGNSLPDRPSVAEDLYRVTAANIVFVTLYSAALLILCINVDHEIQRKWADTVYFLGFILTLVALIVTLGVIDRGTKDGIETVVVQSAIALSSTAFALIFRTFAVAFIRIKPDEDDPSFETLASQILGIAHAIERVGGATKSFSIKLNALEEKADGAATRYAEALGTATDALQSRAADISAIEVDQHAITNQIAGAVEAALAGAEGAVQAFVDASETSAQAVVTAGVNAGEALTTTAQSVTAALGDSATQTNQATLRLKSAFETAANSLEKLDLAELLSQTVREDFSVFSDVLESQRQALADALDTFQTTIRNGAETQEASYREAAAFFAQVDAQASALDRLNTSIQQTMDTLGKSPLAPEWQAQEAERIASLDAALTRVADMLERIAPKPAFHRVRKFIDWFRRKGEPADPGKT